MSAFPRSEVALDRGCLRSRSATMNQLSGARTSVVCSFRAGLRGEGRRARAREPHLRGHEVFKLQDRRKRQVCGSAQRWAEAKTKHCVFSRSKRTPARPRWSSCLFLSQTVFHIQSVISFSMINLTSTNSNCFNYFSYVGQHYVRAVFVNTQLIPSL